MRGLLGDHNIQGQVRIIAGILQGREWNEVWSFLGVPLLSFQDVGLSTRASDADIWRKCQENEWVLITANRNEDSNDSLEAVIKRENQSHHLPVLTLTDANRAHKSKKYAKRVVEKLLTYLLEVDKFRGAGRLYLP